MSQLRFGPDNPAAFSKDLMRASLRVAEALKFSHFVTRWKSA
jgi:hypothetical protein